MELISKCEKPDTPPLQAAAVLQLLASLLHQTKTEKLILSKIAESFFDKILYPLLNVKIGMSENCLNAEEINKYVYCLLLLINFADIAKKAYLEKCCLLLQTPQVQYTLARAMLLGDAAVCKAVFAISQFEHFPRDQIAKVSIIKYKTHTYLQ